MKMTSISFFEMLTQPRSQGSLSNPHEPPLQLVPVQYREYEYSLFDWTFERSCLKHGAYEIKITRVTQKKLGVITEIESRLLAGWDICLLS